MCAVGWTLFGCHESTYNTDYAIENLRTTESERRERQDIEMGVFIKMPLLTASLFVGTMPSNAGRVPRWDADGRIVQGDALWIQDRR
jgi:hypothetical protein